MTLKTLVTASLMLAAGTVLSSHAQITSNFSTDADGWTAKDISAGSNPAVNYISTGNPGGAISTSWVGSAVMYWWAPSKFLGNVAYSSLGETLSFDVETTGSPIGHGAAGDIEIIGANNQSIWANFTMLPSATSTWTHMSIALDETGNWKSGSISGSAASRSTVIDILTSVAAIKILVPWKSSGESGVVGGLDNVVMGVHPAIATAPSITSISSGKGTRGSNVTITGTNFGASAANNEVWFGLAKGTIVSANATSIVATVPTEADYGPIRVRNIATGLSASSLQMFAPMFASGNGGKIIKASFAQDVLYNKTVGRLAHGDLNGDGKPEMVAAYGTEISVFENQSTIGSITATSFAPRINMDPSLADTYYEINVNDLDGDGKLDIFFAFRDSPDAGRIGVLRNINTGGAIGVSSFATIQEFNVPIYVASMATSADLDGDGRPELIGWGGSCAPSPVYVLQNISTPGNVNFTAALSFGGANTCSGRTQFADLDGDGKLDIVESTGAETRIFRNTSVVGTISFDAGVDLGDGGSFASLGDLDNDGKPEIVYANGGMKIRKNVSTPGTLTAGSFSAAVVFTGGVSIAKIADINGDGKPDIITGTNTGTGLGIYQNITVDGQINTSSFMPVVPVEPDKPATEIDIFDVDGDGLPDIVSNNGAQGSISINQNVIKAAPTVTGLSSTAGAPGSAITITGTNFSTVPAQNTVYFAGARTTVTNATSTSLEVLVPFGATYDQVSVALNGYTIFSEQYFNPKFSGGHSFDASAFAAAVDITLPGTTSDGLSATDFDGDGKVDLLADNGSGASVARNIGSDGVIDAATFAALYTGPSQGLHIKTGDFDGDGKVDFNTQNYIFRNSSDAALPNPIAFEAAVTREYSTGSRFANARDLNNDGKVDVVFTNATTNINYDQNVSRAGAFVASNLTYGTFTNVITVPRPMGNGYAAVADLDDDGFNDIVATNYGGSNFTAFLNAGSTSDLSTTSFNTGTNFTTGNNPDGVAILDFDGDGKMDVAVANDISGVLATISVFRNISTAGNINFTRQDFAAASGPTAIVAADMDGDGKPDLVAINEYDNSFSIFRNKSTAGVLDVNSFEARTDYAVGTTPKGLAIADIDRDMRPDVIITRLTTFISIYKNLVPLGPSISFLQQAANKTACENGVATFTTTATGADNLAYQWQLFNTITNAFDDIAGATLATLTVNGITASTNGNIYRSRVNGDGASEKISDPVTLTVSPSPAAPTTSGDTACKGSSLTLTAGGSIDGLYRWYDSPVSQQAINDEVNSTFATPVIFSTATFYAAIANADGCVSGRTAAIATIAPLTKPDITSDGTLLCGVNSIAISGPSGFSEYNWSNLESTQDIDVDLTGSYSLIVKDANGCQSLESDPIVITAGSVAKPAIEANKEHLCSADDSVILTGPIGFAGYVWSTGETTQAITVTQEGSYNVIVTNDAGCHSETSDDVTVSSGADKPAISVGDNVLVSTPAQTYQWYFGDTPIPDATKQFLDFNPFAYGNYTVQVTDLSGCVATSDLFVNLVTGIGEQLTSNTVYPNPFADVLVISTDTDEAKLFDTTGKEIKRLTKGENNVSSLSHGLYFVRVRKGNELMTIKVLK